MKIKMKKKLLFVLPALIILASLLFAQQQYVRLLNTGGTDWLYLVWNEADANDRTLNITVNASNRTFALHGNLTVESASLINQDLTTDSATAQLATLTLSTSLVLGDGDTVGAAGAPVLTFDDTNNWLELDSPFGIGTATIPHGGIGWAKLAIEGTNASVDGPHIQFTTALDNYPLTQFLMYRHDDMSIRFDSYWDGANKSSDAGSNYAIFKVGDVFKITYDSGIAPGNALAWNNGIVLDTSGLVTIGGGINLSGGSITGTSVDINNAELQQLSAIGATTISGTQWGYLGATGAGGGQLLAALTTGESTQLETIGAVTIDNTQWGYLGASDQGFSTSTSPTFGTITSTTGNAILQRSDNDATAANLTFRKNRSGGTVNIDDFIGSVEFYGHDGTNYHRNALITTQVTAAPSDGTDMPGTLLFYTAADGAGDVTQHAAFNHNGEVLFNKISSTNAGDYALKYDAVDGVVYDTSDVRQKSDLQPLFYGLDEIMRLSPKRYFYKKAKKDINGFEITEDGYYTIGLIAQEVYSIIPEAVFKPQNQDKHLWGLNEDKLTPVIINAIQEQQIKIESLEARIEYLENLILEKK